MGRGRLRHDRSCRAKPGTGRLDARSGPALGLWPLLAVVFAAAGVAQVAYADDVPAAAIVAPASAADGLPAVAAAVAPVSAADGMPAVAAIVAPANAADGLPAVAAIVAPANAADGLPAVAAIVAPANAADGLPAVVTYDPSAAAVEELPAAAYDPPSAAVGNGGAPPRDPFRPPSAGSFPRDSAMAKVRLSADMPPSSLFSLRRGAVPGTLSLRADDAPVRQVLQALAALRGLNLVVTPGVEGEITLRLHEMPWRQVLELILTAGGLQQTHQGRTLVVSLQEAPDNPGPGKAAAPVAREEGAPLVNRLITLQYADAAEVASSIDAKRSSLLSSRGSVRLDKRTNSLVLRDTASALASVGDWIAVWDVPLEQVLITAHIVTISRENLREVGVNWRYPAESTQDDARAIAKMPVDGHLARMGLPLARLNGRMLELELTALEQENKVDILASPRLYTAHQQTASIKQGAQIPYPMTSGHGKHPSIQFKEAVLCMEVTPRILRNGRITLDLRLSQNVPGSVIKQGDSQSVTIDTEEIKTQVTIADGETIVLGGIFQHQKQRSHDRVPLLADIPLVGALFKRQRANYKQRELVIFITPTRISG